MSSSLRVVRAAVFALALGLANPAFPTLASDQIVKGAEPAWVVLTADPATPAPATNGDGLRFLLFDTQLRAEANQQSTYVRTRTQAASPQGLIAMGNIGLMWSPATQDVVVHHVTILRDGQVIDVLASQEFQTLRREENLDMAMLDGRLTAVLQPAGLRVGDVLDLAYTVTSRDYVPGERMAQSIDLNMPLAVDRQRVRASWPSDMPVTARAADGWTPLPIRRAGGYSSIEVLRDNTQPIIIPEDVPMRLRDVNLIELSAYRDWAEVASVIKPLYDSARRLAPDSPLHAEIARIRALSDDPAIQAAAALRLVQDDVRYVALLMGEGAMTPATADETWSRRFGDCKGKTVLLLALLDGLGISAEPAAVSLEQGDFVGQRLPGIQGFDHVLVRAEVAGQTYWLDGTRLGDRRLEDIIVPPFRWALPLVAENGRLEQLVTVPLEQPKTETIIAFDATAGQHVPAKVTASIVMRGDEAAALIGQLGLITPAQRDQGLRSMWSSQLYGATIDDSTYTYDDDASVLTMTAKGSMPLDWQSDGLIPPGSTYAPINVTERQAGPFKDAPFLVQHPIFTRQLVTVRLPNGGQGYKAEGGQFDRTELGYHVSRTARVDGDTATVEILVRSLASEITSAEAEAGRVASEARERDYPRIVAPFGVRMTRADRAALAADKPTTEAAWLDRADTLYNSGDFDGAVEAASHAVELAPESANALANRAIYRFWTDDREGAAADLEKAVELDPTERIAMNGNALIAASEGRQQDVVIEMTRALRQEPTDEFALGMRARAYMAQGQHERALRDVDALLAVAPDRVDMKLFRTNLLDQLGRQTEAGTALTALLGENPGDQRTVRSVAAFQLARGDPQAAYDLINGLMVGGDEANPDLLIQRAEAAIALGRLDEAARDFQVVRRAHPDESFYLNNLCWSAARAGVMLDQALRDCNEALEINPGSPAILDSKGRVLLQQGKAAAARAVYDEALAEVPDQTASLYGRGLARIALGEIAAGEADKAAALALDPGAADDFKNYAPVTGDAQP